MTKSEVRHRAGVVESTMPFKVRASCGHIVIRRMREATAGVAYTEETVLEAPNGRACDTCERLFIGCYPTGLVYADKGIEVAGDYKRIAYLNYATLVLDVDDLKSVLLPAIREDAARMQAQRGEQFPIAGNMSVTLGVRSLTLDTVLTVEAINTLAALKRAIQVGSKLKCTEHFQEKLRDTTRTITKVQNNGLWYTIEGRFDKDGVTLSRYWMPYPKSSDFSFHPNGFTIRYPDHPMTDAKGRAFTLEFVAEVAE